MADPNPFNLEKTSCPHCGSGHFIRYGRTRLGRQRYRCRECRKTFSETTGTPFMYSKKTLRVWADYLFCMGGGLTLRQQSFLYPFCEEEQTQIMHALQCKLPPSGFLAEECRDPDMGIQRIPEKVQVSGKQVPLPLYELVQDNA